MSTESDLKNLLITSTKANNALVRELRAQGKAMNNLATAIHALAGAIATVAHEGDQDGDQEGKPEPQRYADGSLVGS